MIRTYQRPSFRAAFDRLRAQVTSAVAHLGRAPLADILEPILMGDISDRVRPLLKLRGDVSFDLRHGRVELENAGTEVRAKLQRFTIRLPPVLRGEARLVDDGVVLRFDPSFAPSVRWYFLSIEVERFELMPDFACIRVQGGSFDQCVVLK